MLVENFVTEAFFMISGAFSYLLIVHQLEAPSTESVLEDDFRLHDHCRCIKALWAVQLLHLNSFRSRQSYV